MNNKEADAAEKDEDTGNDIQKNIIRIGNHTLSAAKNVKSGIIKRGNGMKQTDADGPEQGIILYKNDETQCCADQFD